MKCKIVEVTWKDVEGNINHTKCIQFKKELQVVRVFQEVVEFPKILNEEEIGEIEYTRPGETKYVRYEGVTFK